MEIITNLVYKKDRHNLLQFLNGGFKPFIIHLMDPRLVAKALDGKTIYQAIETIITRRWTVMLAKKGLTVGQAVTVGLADDAWCKIYLLTRGYGDRAVIMVSGQHDHVNYFDIGFVGDESVFLEYLNGINVTELEAYSNAYHYRQEEAG